MDLILEVLDPYLFDPIYTHVPRLVDPSWTPPPPSDRYRQFLSAYLVLWWGGSLLYLVCASLSWLFLFDKKLRKDKFFLPNQEFQEMKVALSTVFIMAFPQAIAFYLEMLGYARLHDKPIVGTAGWLMLIGNCVFYILFTDCLIYWIHRWLHHPVLYGPIHKLHHKWIVSTPFASHAFHWLDGYLQGLPYHIFVFLFPMNKFVYVIFFIIVNMWTVSIHDGAGFYKGIILNGSDHHTIHHRQFTYNYGQYFTFWDRLCGTHKAPEDAVKKGQ
jgi:lathosterol oxidase